MPDRDINNAEVEMVQHTAGTHIPVNSFEGLLLLLTAVLLEVRN